MRIVTKSKVECGGCSGTGWVEGAVLCREACKGLSEEGSLVVAWGAVF